MLDRSKTQRALARLFSRQSVADLPSIESVLGTTSRASVFRILSEIGYRTSYSHAGRYYTLEDVPRFDEDGLWAYGEILFSKHRTLRATIVHFVDAAPAGQTHSELQARVRLRVHDTLHDLLEQKLIGRAAIDDLYVYVSARRVKARRQVSSRRRLLEQCPKHATLPNRSVIIDVLLAFIHHQREDPVALASILERDGKRISPFEIHAVFEKYGLGKKKRRRGTGGRKGGVVPPPS